MKAITQESGNFIDNKKHGRLNLVSTGDKSDSSTSKRSQLI